MVDFVSIPQNIIISNDRFVILIYSGTKLINLTYDNGVPVNKGRII